MGRKKKIPSAAAAAAAADAAACRANEKFALSLSLTGPGFLISCVTLCA